MTKEVKRNIPKLRFPGFTDGWKQRKFFEFAQRESTFRLSSSEYPSVEYEDVVSEEGRLNKNIRLKEIQKNGIAFDGTQVLYGKLRPYLHNWLNPDFTGVAVGDWWVLRPIGMDKKFLYRLVQTQQFDEVANQSSGSKMPRADWNLVSNTEFITPSSLDEQRRIAETFDSIDNLVTLHQRKLDQIKEYKKGLLQKMFPKDGENVPEIRFPGFTGDWEQSKLGELMDVTSVKRIHQSDWTDSGIRFLRARDIVAASKNEEVTEPLYISTDKYNEYSAISGKVKIGDLLVTGVGSIGVPMLIKSDEPLYFKDGNIIWFKNENSIEGSFFFHSFMGTGIQNYIHESSGKGTVGTYTIDSGKKTPILLPKTKEEQAKIGGFFDDLDNVIILHQRKLEKMKEYKKGLLQQMFV